LINSDIPAEEKSLDRLVHEGIILIGAGTVTTAHVLSTVAYHILANPEILQTLQKELQKALPVNSQPSPQALLIQLEHLPYLSAIIKEGFRLTHAIAHRNFRVAPNRSLKFRDWTIPPGTIVGMTAYMLHTDPNVYPSPQEFRPERWLAVDGSLSKSPQERYLLPFGKGSRICLGMNLAYAELYMTLAAVFRRFELQLFETTRADVEMVHDFIAGTPRLDSKGMRVIVVRKRDE
jgi:cytochrome P450